MVIHLSDLAMFLYLHPPEEVLISHIFNSLSWLDI